MTAVAAVRSLIAYVVILSYIVVAAPLALFFGVILRWKSGMWALGHAGAKLALALAGIRYRVSGSEHRAGRGVQLAGAGVHPRSRSRRGQTPGRERASGRSVWGLTR